MVYYKAQIGEPGTISWETYAIIQLRDDKVSGSSTEMWKNGPWKWRNIFLKQNTSSIPGPTPLPIAHKAREGDDLQYSTECNSFLCWVFWKSNVSCHAAFDAYCSLKLEGIWGIKPKTLNLLFVKKSLCKCLIDGVLEAPNTVQKLKS